MKELRILGMVVWLITGLSALNRGLEMFGWGLGGFIARTLPWLAWPLGYIVGLSGLISLLLFLKSVASGGKCCD